MSEKPVFILVGDSRICGFESFKYDNFEFRYVIQRGAVIQDLVNKTANILQEYKGKDRSIIIKIACGINDFTKFEEYQDGKVLRYKNGISSRKVKERLIDFKKTLKTEVPTAVVGFITIPTLSFDKYRQFRANKNKDRNSGSNRPKDRSTNKPTLCVEDLQADQEKLNRELTLLNADIKLENSRNQTGLVKGCYTVSWHNSVTKVSIRKNRSGSRKVVRNHFSFLYDGLHPEASLKKRWHQQLVKCATAEVELIKQYNLKNTKVTFCP